jgi:hypothetical protein
MYDKRAISSISKEVSHIKIRSNTLNFAGILGSKTTPTAGVTGSVNTRQPGG